MSTPIIESIAVDIAAAIDAITEANGFNQDLTAYRPRRIDWSEPGARPADGKVLIKQEIPELAESTVGTQTWRVNFVCMALVIDSDSAATSIDTRLNQVRADIEKKLMEDPTRGGYAHDTQVQPPVEFATPSFTGIAVVIAVDYRTKIADPYTKG